MSNISLIDTHCHLDFKDFDHDRSTVIEKADAVGVKDIIVPSVTQDTWQRTISLCNNYNSLHLALGLHPIFIQQHEVKHLDQLDSLISKHKPIAVGEIGLDFYTKEDESQWDKQRLFFERQLSIANQHNLPVIIHNRKAHDECIKTLKQNSSKGGIIHAFNGSLQQAYHYIDLGFLLGFGGMITFERSSKLRSLLKALPIDSIVLETDAPDMSVQQHKGERNSPEYLPFILQSIVELTQKTPNEIAQHTRNNVLEKFQLS